MVMSTQNSGLAGARKEAQVRIRVTKAFYVKGADGMVVAQPGEEFEVGFSFGSEMVAAGRAVRVEPVAPVEVPAAEPQQPAAGGEQKRGRHAG